MTSARSRLTRRILLLLLLLVGIVTLAQAVAATEPSRPLTSYLLGDPMPGGVAQPPSAEDQSRALAVGLDRYVSEVFQLHSAVPIVVAYAGWHERAAPKLFTSVVLVRFDFPPSVSGIESAAYMQGAIALLSSQTPATGAFCPTAIPGIVPLPDVLPVHAVPSAYALVCPRPGDVAGVDAVVFGKEDTMAIIESTVLDPFAQDGAKLDVFGAHQFDRLPTFHPAGAWDGTSKTLVVIAFLGAFLVVLRRTRRFWETTWIVRSVTRRPTVRYLLARLGFAVGIMVVVTFATTMLAGLLPGNAAIDIYPGLQGVDAAFVNYHLGFDNSLLTQYWHWLVGAFGGNLGNSLKLNETVGNIVKVGTPITLEIAVAATLISILVAIPTALISAARPGGALDRFVALIGAVSFALPVYVSSVLLVELLAVKLKWVPNEGWVHISTSLDENLRTAALPVATLVLTVFPVLLVLLRADLLAVARSEFVLAARSRGLPEWYVLTRHVLRPASAAVITYSGIAFGTLVGGSCLVENFFEIPGLGFFVYFAVNNKDITTLQGIVVIVALAFVVINTIVDVAYLWLDPRVRVSRHG